jgi:heat shock protein HtpX
MSSYVNVSAADWRKQLRKNDFRTKIVMGLFVLIYLSVGFLVDLYLKSGLYNAPLVEIAKALLTFKILPAATLVTGLIAIISILITYAFHDRIILLGTEYREINLKTAQNLAEQQLYNVITELQIAAGLRFIPKVYLIEADYMNAFASGYSEKSALVAITRGLLEKLNRSELQAVMAHELNHIKHHDIKLTLMASVLSNLMLIVLDILFRSAIFGIGSSEKRERRDENGGNILLIAIIILRIVLPILTLILMLYLSRTREYMADAGAVELTRDNNPLAQALLKINNDYLEQEEHYHRSYQSIPHENVRRPAYIFDPAQAGIKGRSSLLSLFSTHPSLDQRLKALGFVKK